MSKREEIEKNAEVMITPMLDEKGFELVDVEYVREAGENHLRFYIDKPGGITIDDCEIINRQMSDLLDDKDIVGEAYILEVSSPGLGRPLKKDKDFERSIGEEVDVRLYKSIVLDTGGKKPVTAKLLTGVLKSYSPDDVTITYTDKNGSEKDIVIQRKDISLIRLAFDF